MTNNKHYLGDGVYIEEKNHQLILTTYDGMDTCNTIFINNQVETALRNYFERRRD